MKILKIKQVIEKANLMEPGNVLPPELAIMFLSELDGLIQSDIMLHAPEEIVEYTDQEQELLLRPPHDKLYIHYLVAMIRQVQQEYEGYNNAQGIVDEKLKTFRRWYVSHYRPADTRSRSYVGGTSADGVGFAYLSAYGIAVKLGYTGTEEEWLESLIGSAGEPARMRYDAEREMIQWGVGEQWEDLFALGELRDPAVAAFLAQAEAAAENAQRGALEARDQAYAAADSAAAAGESAEQAETQAEAAQTARAWAGQAAQTSSTAAQSAGAYASAAASAADRSEAAVQTAASAAESAAEATRHAAVYKGQAENSAAASAASADDAQTRAEIAKNYAERAEAAAERAENALGGGVDETDPTVPEWAKQAEKPAYTAQEVGARPDDWVPTAEEVGADPAGTASRTVAGHNVDRIAHEDLRLLVQDLTDRLNALANSTDEDLDQMAEIVAYIKSNKSLIDAITTSKVSVAEIVDNLVTNVSDKPLSAAQGVALKALVDAIPAWAMAASKPTYSKSEVGLGDVDNVRQYSASNPPPYPVTSVNGQTGAVALTAADVGAMSTATAQAVINNALDDAKKSGEFDGEKGEDGRGIQSIDRTSGDGTAGTVDTYTITYTDGSTSTYQVRNGSNGAAGQAATLEITGATALEYGAAPTITEAEGSTAQARKIVLGIPAGKPGDSYVLTEDDKNEIAALVLEMLGGNPVWGVVDENNHVTVYGLSEGAYTLGFVMADGSTIDIGNLVLDNNVYYSITNTLTNCTNGNSATQVVEGGSYEATITANSGYELESVVVTMGGVDVSADAVSGGNISIAEVTGNIVITAVAEEIVVNYTNLFVPSEATINKRLNSSKVAVDLDGYVISNFIDVSGETPFTSSTKVYIKGATFTSDANTKVMSFKTTSGTDYTSAYGTLNGSNLAVTDEGNGVISFTGASSNVASTFADDVKRMVLVLQVSDSAITEADIQNIVITIDEPIG